MTIKRGLREEKKARTRADLADAAYRLVREHGMRSLTADAIADRAGVSRRTFFNYFPSVESALTYTVSDFFEALSAQLEARPTNEPLMESLDHMADGVTDPELLERITVMGAMGEASPQARRMLREFTYEWLEWFETYIAARIGKDADDLYVSALATALIAASESAVRVWGRRTAGAITPQTIALFRDLLGQSLRLLQTGFDPASIANAQMKDR
jgi:AcrR family transcriptional regulator